jgi:hypothetical protein
VGSLPVHLDEPTPLKLDAQEREIANLRRMLEEQQAQDFRYFGKGS